jgi:hypothetical protein
MEVMKCFLFSKATYNNFAILAFSTSLYTNDVGSIIILYGYLQPPFTRHFRNKGRYKVNQ